MYGSQSDGVTDDARSCQLAPREPVLKGTTYLGIALDDAG